MVETEAKVDFLFEYLTDWIDERLRWSPDDYCGITHLYVGLEDVWIPEVSIVEAHSSQDFRQDYQKFVWINHTGELTAFFPTFTSTVCKLQVHDFPFDEQNCSINLMPQSFSPYEFGYVTKFNLNLMNQLDKLV
ncbi:hypothetical protein OSTOST_23288 [Ostertagia ostertagi]